MRPRRSPHYFWRHGLTSLFFPTRTPHASEKSQRETSCRHDEQRKKYIIPASLSQTFARESEVKPSRPASKRTQRARAATQTATTMNTARWHSHLELAALAMRLSSERGGTPRPLRVHRSAQSMNARRPHRIDDGDSPRETAFLQKAPAGVVPLPNGYP